MKLHLTATSERGKPVTKSGNEWLMLEIIDEDRNPITSFTIYPKNRKGDVHMSLWTSKRVVRNEKERTGMDLWPKTAKVYFGSEPTKEDIQREIEDYEMDKPKTAREYCFQCSPDGKYTIKGVCKVCEDINKRADKTAREECKCYRIGFHDTGTGNIECECDCHSEEQAEV